MLSIGLMQNELLGRVGQESTHMELFALANAPFLKQAQ